jgi:hypothetical protein
MRALICYFRLCDQGFNLFLQKRFKYLSHYFIFYYLLNLDVIPVFLQEAFIQLNNICFLFLIFILIAI